jgi:cell division septum initiation protein DivIVA
MQILIGLGLCLFVALGVQTFRVSSLKEEIAAKEAAIAAATAMAEREARTREQAMADNARKAADTYAQNLKRNEARASSVVAELDGLRNDIAAASPAAPVSAASGSTNGTGGLERELLGNCAAALVGMAQAAQRLEAKVIGLQDYVKGLAK